MRGSCVALTVALSAGTSVFAQQPETVRKQARAMRVSSGTITIDGRLAEDAWSRAPSISDFVQKEPDEGGAPSDRIEVQFLYDDTALYVAARMSSEHAAIQSPLGRRDDVGQSELVIIALDTYLDHRTAYGFGVTAISIE